MNSQVPQIKDIDPIWIWPYHQWVHASLLIALGLLILGGGYLLFRLWKNRKAKRRTPYQMLCQSLERLKESQEASGSLYLQLDLSLRRYLDSVWFCQFTEWTLIERQNYLQKHSHDTVDQDWLSEFWKKSEMVKFAGFSVPKDEFLNDVTHIQNLVNQLHQEQGKNNAQ